MHLEGYPLESMPLLMLPPTNCVFKIPAGIGCWAVHMKLHDLHKQHS